MKSHLMLLPFPFDRILTALVTLAASLAMITSGRAEANYVYHERTSNDPGCGGQYVNVLAPNASQSVTVRFKVEYQFYVNTARIYYTTDGSTPAGAFGTGSGTTQVGTASFACTFGDPVVDVWEATIPAQPAGTMVKYILGAWHSDGGDEIFANGCGNCGSENSSFSLASVFSYTVTSANGSWAAAASGNWSDASKWNASTIAGGASSIAWFTNVDWTGQTVTVDIPRTVGQLVASDGAASGGTALTISGGIITLDNGANKPQISSTTFAEFQRFKLTSTLAGSNGFEKVGGGYLDLSGASSTFAGNIKLNGGGGFVVINNDANLGNAANDIDVATTGSATGFYVDSSAGTITLNSGRDVIITGTGDFWAKTKSPANLIFEGVISGTGNFRKNDAGIATLRGSNTFSGQTILQLGTLRLENGNNRLPTGTTLNFLENTMLDMGGYSQQVAALSLTAGKSPTLTNGTFILSGNNNLVLGGGTNMISDFGGLSVFVCNLGGATARTLSLNPGGGNPGPLLAHLAKAGIGSNNITAALIRVGESGPSADVSGFSSTLRLGQVNLINTTNLQVGGYRVDGTLNFNTGLSAPTLRLRGLDGVAPVNTLIIAGVNSGNTTKSGTIDLSGGSWDAAVSDLTVGRHFANANNAVNASLIMPAGQANATVITLARKEGTGTAAITSTWTQGGGTVRAQTLTMGSDAGAGAVPRLLPTYNLNGGTLFAASIDGGGGAFAANSARTLNINGGTLRNYDSTTDLTVDGTDATAGGLLNVVLASGTQTVQSDTGRTITFTALAPISGAGNLTKTGNGTLLLNGANVHAGGTTVSAGTLGGSGSLSSALSVNSGGTLAPGVGGIGTFTVNNAVTLAGSTALEVNKAAGPAFTSDLVAGITTLNCGGAVTVSATGLALAAGDEFTVFNATTYNGSFASITPAPGDGLAWDTNKLATQGKLLVHHRPAAGPNVASVTRGQSAQLAGTKLLANDSDADGDPLTIVAVSAASGTATLSGQNINYTAPGSGSADTITYTVSDSRGGETNGVVTVTLTSPDAPSLNVVSGPVVENNEFKVGFAGLPGLTYAVEDTTVSPAGPWSFLTNLTAGPNGLFNLVVTNNPPAVQRYFRTRYAP